MADIALPPDPTLDEMRAALGAAIPVQAMFDGWGDAALEAAARSLGIDPGHARLAFPDGALGMIDAWYASIDTRLAAAFPPERIAAMKIRDRIGALILARLDLVRPVKQAARTALTLLARHPATAAKLGWRAADTMWRIAGDTATDLNHYTKRLTLSGVYGSTLRGFLDRRLGDVMRIEKVKAQLRLDPERRFSVTRLLGRLRYPAV